MEDTDDTDQEEDPILYVPEPDDDTLAPGLAPGLTDQQLTDDSPYDDDDDEEEEQNWLQLQNVSTE